MLAQATAALPALQDNARRPAGPEGVRRVIAKRLALLPSPQGMGPEESAAWWGGYFDVLADLPEAALEAAMGAYLRDPKAEFMPKPGKLRALALETPNAAVRAYDRARKAVEASRPPEPTGPRVDPAEVERMMAEFRAGLVKRDTKPEPKLIEPAVDEQGLSSEMRRRLEEMRR